MVSNSLRIEHFFPFRLCGAALLLAGAAGCFANSDETIAPRDQFVSPTGLAVSPPPLDMPDEKESVLFVSSANAELLYNSGSVLVIDLQEVDDLIEGWLSNETIPANCRRDEQQPGALQCDESVVIDAERGVRIGSFASEIALQQLDGGDLRLIAAVRGDPSITWADYKAPSAGGERELSCGDQTFPLCDGDNRLISLRNDSELQSLVPEPFGVYVGSAGSNNDYALVTHLSFGNVSLVDLPRGTNADGDVPPPVISDSLGLLFDSDPNDGTRAAVGVAGRKSPDGSELVYVTSRSEQRVRVLYIDRNGPNAILVPVESFFLTGIQSSTDSRGITFNNDGTRAYIVNRAPAALHVIDTSGGDTGFPRNDPIGFVELCRDASNVAATTIAGRGDRVYVACFPGGQVWAMAPELSGDPVAIIDVGRGPHAVAVAKNRNRLYVANVLEDTVTVVDLTPGGTHENRVVLRLGVPRQSEGE